MSRTDDAPVAPGDILAGKYRVERVLGVGAMGVVVAAMHVELHELRAIKFMLPSMLADVESVERFLREARAAVRLKSQHVAKIQDIGRLETGAPYMVMEYLDGHDLKHVLDARGPLPVHEAVTYLIQVCEAIAEAHALGIVHRDLKPANLFLTMGANGLPCVKVLDFGIAKVIDAQGGLDVTRTQALLGTPLYMSPEQMRGARNVDGRSDVWALGAILYRMLTGKTPFVGSSVTEICAAVVSDQPDPPAMVRADVPPELDAAVMRCLEKNVAKRFATAAQLAAAIAPFALEVKVAPSARGLKPALSGTAILDASYAVPQAISPTAAAHAPQPIHAPQASIAARPSMAAEAPIAAPTPLPAPRPITTPPSATPTGNTAHASTWTAPQPIDAPPARASSARVAVIASVIAIVVLGSLAAAFLMVTRHGSEASNPVASTSAAQAAPPFEPTASPTTDTSAAPSAVETAAATAIPTATTAPLARPQPRVPVATAKPKSKDAFGHDRK